MDAKYLRVTIHDNDFMCFAESLMESIQYMFKFFNFYPKTEEDLNRLKPAIANLWNSFYMLDTACRQMNVENRLDMFEKILDLEIVDFNDIPDWDNYESMYIPLFKDGECIIK